VNDGDAGGAPQGGDTVHSLVVLVQTVAELFFWLILIRAILSWIRPGTYSPAYRNIMGALYALTEPILAPIRRLLPATAGVDWSPLVALVLIRVVEAVLIGLLR